MTSSAAVRTGRQPGDSGNRERILAAARHQFAAKGFRATTLRAIAAHAEVDVALISHYYRNKDGLFTATLQLPDSAKDLALRALTGPAEMQGERLTRAYLGLWEDPDTSAQMQALARSALSTEIASTRIRTLLEGVTADPALSEVLAGRREGFALAMAHLLGIAFGRYLSRIPALTDLDFNTLVVRTAPAVQLHLAADTQT